MKLQKRFRRAAAALLSGAMLLNLCAPALAQAPAAEPGVQLQAAESSTDAIIFNNMTFDPAEDAFLNFATAGSTPGASMEYRAASHLLTVTGTVYDPLTISAPGVDVVLCSADGPAVDNSLTISACASAAITSTKEGAQAITGTASITSSGSVSITGTDSAVGGESLTVDAGGDVAITGGTASSSTLNSADIACGGEMELCNPAGGTVLNEASSSVGCLRYANTSTAETAFRHDHTPSFWMAVWPDSEIQYIAGLSPSWITAKHEQTYTVTMTDCFDPNDPGSISGQFYVDETVRLDTERPADGTTFDRWQLTAADGQDIIPESEYDTALLFQMPACAVSAAALWNRVADLAEPGLTILSKTDGSTTTYTPSGLKEQPVDGISYDAASNTFTVSFTDSAALQVLGVAPTADQRPSVVFQNAALSSLTLNGAQDVAFVDTVIEGTASTAASGAVLLENVRDVQFTGSSCRSLVVQNAQNFKAVTSGILCSDNMNLKCTGDVEITCTAADPDVFANGAAIAADGRVALKGAPKDYLHVGASRSLTLNAAVLPQWLELYSSGTAEITQRNADSADWDVDANLFHLRFRQSNSQPIEVSWNGETSTAPDGFLEEYDMATLRQLRHLLITPESELPAIDAAPASGGDIGGAIAAAALGGAAVWGSYEAATRIILHRLLPAGAAIPKTQAELAVLVWNNAGQPEPTGTPAFSDVDEATAKAAQWCTEQGLLDSFSPAKHVTKYRVIRVWKQAFPTN